jgi:hypothetical protein
MYTGDSGKLPMNGAEEKSMVIKANTEGNNLLNRRIIPFPMAEAAHRSGLSRL